MIKFNKKDTIADISFQNETWINQSVALILEKKVKKLVNQKINRIIMDLKNIHFIDSAGFRILMRLNENSRFDGTDIILTNISPKLMEIFLLLKLDNKFNIDILKNPDQEKAA